MGLRYNPPPTWPPPPPGFTPKRGWQPDPAWPPPPAGWPFWVDDDEPAAGPDRPSRWALASFILGIFAVVPLSVIFSLVGLARIRRLGQRGRGLAMAGLILSLGWIAVFAAVGLAGHGRATPPSAADQITHPVDLGVFALATGDCFDNPAGSRDIGTVTAIPCTRPHDAQVFAKFDLRGGDSSYPAAAVLNKLADDGCNSRTGRIDRARTTGAMTIRVLFPAEDAWAGGQRTVCCLIVNRQPTLKTSLLTG